MALKLEKERCPKCGGMGEVYGPTTGPQLQALREAAGVPRTKVAEAMGISESYLVDLEGNPKRFWTAERVEKFRAVVEGLSDGKR